MDDMVICGVSAFRYYRTPPQVLALYPPLRRLRGRSGSLSRQPLAVDVLQAPVHALAFNRASRAGTYGIRFHLWQGETPVGHIRETRHGFRVVSPQFALLQMAQQISETRLLMAMYEACGWFSIYSPSDEAERALSLDPGQFLPGSGWRRARGRDGKAADLWQRPPLVEIEELLAFSHLVQGRRGCMKFKRAAEMVSGVAASPFEAQASMLLSLPRNCGGEGIAGIENNVPVKLSASARAISGLSKCYVDLLISNDSLARPLAIECQGRLVHGLGGVTQGDANRIVALESMGFDVVPLTYEQICEPHRFRAVVDMLSERIGVKRAPKDEVQLAAERDLRWELFSDWGEIEVR